MTTAAECCAQGLPHLSKDTDFPWPGAAVPGAAWATQSAQEAAGEPGPGPPGSHGNWGHGSRGGSQSREAQAPAPCSPPPCRCQLADPPLLQTPTAQEGVPTLREMEVGMSSHHALQAGTNDAPQKQERSKGAIVKPEGKITTVLRSFK